MSVMAISPNGANVVYSSNDRFYLRGMSGDAMPIAGTSQALNPVFSPDGEWLAFWMRTDRRLKKMSIHGGAMITLSESTGPPSSLSWVGDKIVYGGPEGIVAVPAAGGRSEVWMRAEPGEFVTAPQLLDDGAVLFSVTKSRDINRWDNADIGIFSRETGDRKILIHGGSDARYIPTGHIVYIVGNTLFAAPFDLKRRVVGSPATMVEGVLHLVTPVTDWPFAVGQFGFSANGTLIYVPVNPQPAGPSGANREIRVVTRWFDEIKRRLPS